MKKIRKILISLTLVLILTGCKGKEIITKCSLESDQSANGYVLKADYSIYSEDNIVKKVVINQTITSKDKEKLEKFKKTFDNQYKSNNKSYGGYKYKIKIKDNQLILNLTTDYTKLDMKKFVKDNAAMGEYLDDNKLVLDKFIDLYSKSGITCKK